MIKLKLPYSIFALAWPVILSNITIPLLGIIDLSVIGRNHQSHDLAAIAVGSIFFDALFGLTNFLRMSTTGLTAKSPTDLNILYRALLMALLIAGLILAAKPALWQICYLLANYQPSLKSSLMDYFNLRCWSAPAVLINYVLIGFCFGQGNTKLPLKLLLITNSVNILLDFILVYYLNLATKGLALANLLAQWLTTLIGYYLIYKQYQLPFNWLKHMDSSRQQLIKLLHINKNIFIRTACLMSTIGYFTHLGSQLGSNVVAANAILISLIMLMSYFMDGFAIACEVFIGRALSRQDKTAFMDAVLGCGSWALIVAITFSLLWYLLGKIILGWMTDIATIYNLAKIYLPWLYGLPLVAFLSYLMDGIYIGATWTAAMRNTMFFSAAFIFLPSTILFSALANHGLWLSYTLFLLSRGLSLLFDLNKKIRVTFL